MSVLQQYLLDYGYPILFVVVLLESLGIPGPGQTLLITAALLAAHGKLDITAVLVTSIVGTTLGGMVGYWVGRKGGRTLILRYGRYIRIDESELGRLESSFASYGLWFVLVARFLEVLRQIQGIVAGTVEMPFRRFFLANLVGGILWSVVWGFGSFKLGRQIRSVDDLTDKAGLIVVVLGLGVLLMVVGIYMRRRWRGKDPGP